MKTSAILKIWLHTTATPCSAQNIQRYNFTLATTVLNTEVGDDCATVELYAHITFQYEEGGETAECGDRYQVTFGKVGGTWCIVDIVSEEMIAYGMTPDSFNLDAAIAEFARLQEQGAGGPNGGAGKRCGRRSRTGGS